MLFYSSAGNILFNKKLLATIANQLGNLSSCHYD